MEAISFDGVVDSTFFAAYESLVDARKRRLISTDEFIKGLLEIIRALSLFSEYERAFDDTEIKMQSAVLNGFLHVLNTFLDEVSDKAAPFNEELETLKLKRLNGQLDTKAYWKALLEMVISSAEKLHEIPLAEDKKRYIIPFLVSFIKYFHCLLVQKREESRNL